MSINPSTAPGYMPPGNPVRPAQPVPADPAASSGSGIKMAILFGAVIALLAANVYLFMQVRDLRTELGKTQNSLLAELDKVRETSNISTQTSRRNVENLEHQLEVARRQANAAAGDAKVEALKRVEQTKAELQAAQAKAQQLTDTKISEVRAVADTATTKIGEVNTEVSTVKTDLGATKSELEKTVADLKRTAGDVDGHSTLIATNSKELAALRTLGERNYIEFNIHKSKTAQKVGDVGIQLKKADPKRNRYTIELTADDKTVEKRDRTINEPLQFLTSKARQPYEIVVNDVKKDQISGYLAVPKVLNNRGS